MDLLDLVAPAGAAGGVAGGAAAGVTHVVMPNMSLACGGSILALPRGDRITFRQGLAHGDASCPGCLAVPDLLERIAAMQRRQA